MASFLLEYYRAQRLEAALLDLRDVTLPLCDGDAAYDHPESIRCTEFLADARVIIVATPVYNYDVNATVKNLVELTGPSWENKVVGFICAAGGLGSYMSVMSFANSLMLDFRCLIIPRFVYATSDDFQDDRISAEEIKQRLAELGGVSSIVRYG
jgi:NAD(P)H-dependent FMN reductase